jgi:hypothetical protein
MSKNSSAKTKKEYDRLTGNRQPWIERNTGFMLITIVSIGLAVWVAWQSILGGGTFWKGALWGICFGASIWLVFFGMNYFHSLFNKTGKDNDKKGK